MKSWFLLEVSILEVVEKKGSRAPIVPGNPPPSITFFGAGEPLKRSAKRDICITLPQSALTSTVSR
jgi:hypothetical protein